MVKKPRAKKVVSGLSALYAPKPIKKVAVKKRKMR